MKPIFTLSELEKGILNSSRVHLAKAISLVESSKAEHKVLARALTEAVLPKTGNSIRIGISGIPGAGKSTFIESFGQFLISIGKKVAVLAVDPSSTLTRGSILGDKTRMEELSKSENAFIRPSPSKGYYGGVAISTYESVLMCEAAGYDIILIETVGVGQSETMVADLIDVFVLVAVAGAGDELQGIKRGIMEMAEVIFINKVDEKPTQKDRYLLADLTRALQLFSAQLPGWKTAIIMGSALNHKNIDTLWQSVSEYIENSKKSDYFIQKRQKQNVKRFEALLSQSLVDFYVSKFKDKELYAQKLKEIELGKKSAWKVIAELME